MGGYGGVSRLRRVCHVCAECVTSTESMSRLRRVCHVYGECVTSTESVSRLRRVCPTKPVLCPSRLAMEGCATCTEGFLNAKLRVPTEYGFVRDRGFAESFSSDCMHAEAAHALCQGRVQSRFFLTLCMHCADACATDVCKSLFSDSAHTLCQRTCAKSCIC